MIDIKFLRNNPEIVKENIRKKFQDQKLVLVDEILELDIKYREALTGSETLKSLRNALSKEIGKLMAQGKKAEAEEKKSEVTKNAEKMVELEETTRLLAEEIRSRMMVIPNIIDDSVPLGRNDTENVEVERFGEAVVPDFEIPYHMDIVDRLNGSNLEAARSSG